MSNPARSDAEVSAPAAGAGDASTLAASAPAAVPPPPRMEPSAWRPLQNPLFRSLGIATIVSNVGTWMRATWSLFPLIVRQELGRGPEIYGLLLTCIGIGAVAGAVLLPRLRAKFSRDTLVAAASARYALAALAHVQKVGLLAVAMLATGIAWISILSALQVSAQMTLPAWVRARARCFRGRVHGRNGDWEHFVGASRDTNRHSRCAHDRGAWDIDRDCGDLEIQARSS